MNILHIIPTLGLGGAEKLLVDSLKYYKKNNVECDIAVLSSFDNAYESEIIAQGNTLFVSKETSVYSFNNIRFIKHVIEQKHYDVVHCHLYAAQLFTPIALRMCNYKPILITTEHSTSNRRRGSKIFKLLDRNMYRKYDKIICISHGVRCSFDGYLPSLSRKTIVIDNGIDVRLFQDAPPIDWHTVLPNYQNEKIVLMVASLRHQKDPFTLIDAAKLLGNNYRIVFIGAGELLNEAQAYILQQEICNVDFLGARKDVPALMKAADVFVLSSHWEGFGLVVLEAALVNLPVIATDVPGLRDVVKDIGGQLFESKNAMQLKQKILKVNQYPSKFDEKYTLENMVEQYIQAYKP